MHPSGTESWYPADILYDSQASRDIFEVWKVKAALLKGSWVKSVLWRQRADHFLLGWIPMRLCEICAVDARGIISYVGKRSHVPPRPVRGV